MLKNDGKSFAVELVQMPWCPGRARVTSSSQIFKPRCQATDVTPGARVSFQPPDTKPLT